MKNENLPNLDAKLNYLKDQLLSCEGYSEDQILKLKRSFAHFKSEIKQRWTKAHYKEDNFIKYNRSWLDGTFELPVVETLQKRPSRPSKTFEDSSERSKSRKTEQLRSNFEKEVIIHAAKVELGKSGKKDASNVLKDITSSPKRATKYKKAFYRTKSSKEQPSSLTPMQALQMFVDAELTQGQYEIIRKTNKKFYPCYSALQKAKKNFTHLKNR